MNKILLSLTLLIFNFSIAQDSRLWGTYFGGSYFEYGNGIATDPFGNVYMVGTTKSPEILSYNGFQSGKGSSRDAYLVKFDSLGNRIWSTYYGGNDNDIALAVATDPIGNVYIAGSTKSSNNIGFGGFRNTLFSSGTEDAFLVKFDSAGNRIWGTYYGGAAYEGGEGIAIDQAGNIYLAGTTGSSTGIASGGGFQDSLGGLNDGFLVKFDASGNRIWATYFGGIDYEGIKGVATDPSGNIYMTGGTKSHGLGFNGFQNTFTGSGSGIFEAFLVKFDALGNRIWCTYYGGSGDDRSNGVVTSPTGDVYIAGYACSPSLGFNGFQMGLVGAINGILVKFDGNGNRLWSTYYGIGGETGHSVSCDLNGNPYLAGGTASTSGISFGGFQNAFGGGTTDAFVVKFDPGGSRICSSYYGGPDTEQGSAYTNFRVANDPAGHVFLAGTTRSDSNIAYNGFQDTIGGIGENAFLVKFSSCPLPKVITGVKDFSEGGELQVFPNPSSEEFTISSPSEIQRIEISNSLGEVMYVAHPETKDLLIEFRDKPKGIYIIKIFGSDEKVFTKKLVLSN